MHNTAAETASLQPCMQMCSCCSWARLAHWGSTRTPCKTDLLDWASQQTKPIAKTVVTSWPDVHQPSMGVEQPSMGVEQPSMSVEQPSMSVDQQEGAPQRRWRLQRSSWCLSGSHGWGDRREADLGPWYAHVAAAVLCTPACIHCHFSLYRL